MAISETLELLDALGLLLPMRTNPVACGRQALAPKHGADDQVVIIWNP